MSARRAAILSPCACACLSEVCCRWRASSRRTLWSLMVASTAPRCASRAGLTSRRSLLKGLTALMAVGAVAPLAAACAPQQPRLKPPGQKPPRPRSRQRPPPRRSRRAAAAAQPTAAPKVEAPAADAKPAAAKPGAEPKQGGVLKWAVIGEPPRSTPSSPPPPSRPTSAGTCTRCLKVGANQGPKMEPWRSTSRAATARRSRCRCGRACSSTTTRS